MEGQNISSIQKQLSSTIELLQSIQDDKNLSSKEAHCEARLKEIRQEVMNKINSSLVDIQNEMQQKIQQTLKEFNSEFNKVINELIEVEVNVLDDKKNSGKTCILSQKVHRRRSSLLIKMLKNEDFRTVYHIFIAIMLVMCLGEIVRGYIESGVILDLSLFTWAFGKFHLVILGWLFETSWCLLVVPLVQLIHKGYLSKPAWIAIYTILQIVMFVGPCYWSLHFSLPMASGLVVTCEMARMSMTMHSYLREKLLFGRGPNDYATYIPPSMARKGIKVENLNLPTITIEDPITEFKRFFFYFFSPTLIYRDSYPRITPHRRWWNIIYNLLNVFGTMFYVYLLLHTICIPYFKESWNKPWEVRFILTSWFQIMLPGTMLLVLMFFGILHSWQNLWAEIMRFGDRQFYTDWWNVTSFHAYYRTWNIVVHEWLFQYFYQDVYRFSKGKISQFVGFVLVFVYSAVIHELIIAVSMGFFYPILFAMFGGPGVIYTFFSRQEKRFLNVFVWSMFLVGNGLLVMFYSWEFFARQQIDLYPKYGVIGRFIPHSWVGN